MIPDNILNRSIFTDNHDDDPDFFHNIEKYMNASGIIFPEFVTFEEVKPVHEISWSKETGYIAEGVDGEWESIEELADYIERELKHDAKFHDSILGSPDVEDDLGGMVFLKDKEGRGSSRMLLGPVDKRNIAVYHYYQFLQGAKAWLDNQDDMVLAYYFLEQHPAFWSRSRSRIERFPHEWKMDSGLAGVSIFLSRKETGENVIMLEHGSAVEPERVMHYHDTRLDVWAPTFEEAYIQLAKNVHKYFYLDGESRPDIPYTPQDWEVEVADRLAKWKEKNPDAKDAEKES